MKTTDKIHDAIFKSFDEQLQLVRNTDTLRYEAIRDSYRILDELQIEITGLSDDQKFYNELINQHRDVLKGSIHRITFQAFATI